jgi:hypothetical protein
MSQAATHGTSFKKVLAHPIFNEGYKDAMKGVNFYEKYERLADHQKFSYERGRQFFFSVGKMRIRQGRGATKEAIQVFKYLFQQKIIL